MFEELMGRLTQGLGLIQQGRAVLDEVRENMADARSTMSETDYAKLDAKLDEVMAESIALSARIQGA